MKTYLGLVIWIAFFAGFSTRGVFEGAYPILSGLCALGQFVFLWKYVKALKEEEPYRAREI